MIKKVTDLKQVYKRQSKYGNHKITIDGITFDSKREAYRYKELQLLEKAGAITELELQPRFTLLDKYTNGLGVNIRKMEYVADFSYYKDGKQVIEDTKGHRTKDYLLKKKWFEKAFYPLTITEV